MKKLAKSFVYAFKGILTCIARERNMRIHLSLSVYMFCILGIYDWFTVTRTQYAILFVMCAAVMAGELVNTAVERTVDLACKEKNELAKTAKDCAAGAVLVSAVFAVCCGIAILWQPDAFKSMFSYYKEHIPSFAILILSLIPTMFFIFKGPLSNKKD